MTASAATLSPPSGPFYPRVSFETLSEWVRDIHEFLEEARPVHHFSFQAARSRTGTTKAVGSGEDAGEVLYGKRAEAALARQGRIDRGEPHPELPQERARRLALEREPQRQVARVAFRRVLDDPAGVTADDVRQVGPHLETLTRVELRAFARELSTKVGGLKAELVARLSDFARKRAGEKPPRTVGSTTPVKSPDAGDDDRKKKSKTKVTVPRKMPTGIALVTHQALRRELKAQFVPPPPKAGEISLVVNRPQVGPQEFAQYATGNILYNRGWPQKGVEAKWLTSTVNDLLWDISTSGNTGDMPILADALQDAGCDNEELLSSLRAREMKGWVGKLLSSGPQYYIVTAAKPGYTRGGEGWKKWEQALNVRRATAEEVEIENLHARAESIRYHLTGGVNEIMPENADELRRELAKIEAKIRA